MSLESGIRTYQFQQDFLLGYFNKG